jgi:cyanophycinase
VLASLVTFFVPPHHGACLLVGGGRTTPEMVSAFADLCRGKTGEIVVLPQCHQNPAVGNSSVSLLQKSGFANIWMAPYSTVTEADRKELEIKLDHAVGIWVPGGDQTLFIKRFGLAWCQRVFPKLIERGVNWFGTSAGAMLVGNPMLVDKSTTEGIGLIDGIVDTHYFVRHRELRLRSAFFGCRVQYGFGLDEGEWVILRDNLIERKEGSPQIFLRE